MSVSTRSTEPSMLEVAEQTLAEIHAMRALSQCEDALLTLIDGAARCRNSTVRGRAQWRALVGCLIQSSRKPLR
jgi:hypothetical protein